MNDWSMLKKLIWLHIVKGGGGIERTVKGAIVHVTNALARPAISVKCEVNPIQDLHGYDSPWPAGGGKNLANFPENQTLPTSDVYIDALDFGEDRTIANCTLSLFVKNAVYKNSGGAIVDFLKDDGTHQYRVSSAYGLVQETPNTGKFSKAETNITFRTLRIFCNEAQYARWTGGTMSVQFELSATASDKYYPYSNICPISGRTSATIYHSGEDTSDPTTYTIQLGDTVYGGTLDVTGGKMVVDRAMVDLGTMAWGYQSSPPQFYSNGIAETSINWHSWNDTPPLICSRYKPISNALLASSDFCIGYAYNSKQLRVNDSGFTDAASFKTAMSGVQLVYPLAQPIEITLTPTQIDMLLGENNLWADAGDLTLTYYADGNASTSEALGILLGGTYNNPGGADDVSDDEALEILLGGS